MTNNSVEWKHRAETVFAPLRAIDRSWLPRWLRENTRLLDIAMLGQTSRRIIYNCFRSGDRAIVDDVSSVPKWAHRGPAVQRWTVLRLGALTCSTPLRRTVEQSELGALRDAIDEDVYLEAISKPTPLIRNDVNDEFRRSIHAGDILHFVAAMGLSVLQTVTPQDEVFIRQSLRYLFSTKAWSLVRSDLTCDSEEVMKILSRGSDE